MESRQRTQSRQGVPRRGAPNDSRRLAATTQEAVLAELRRDITERKLRPGDPIKQDEVAERLGVSAIPVREALKTLEGEGLVEYRPHRGCVLTRLTRADFAENLRVCELLEGEAIRVAVPMLDAGDRRHLGELAEDCAQSLAEPSFGATVTAYRRFYFFLFSAADQRVLFRHIELLWNATHAYIALYSSVPASRALMAEECRQIHEAIASGVEIDSVIEVVDRCRLAIYQGIQDLVDDAAEDASESGQR